MTNFLNGAAWEAPKSAIFLMTPEMAFVTWKATLLLNKIDATSVRAGARIGVQVCFSRNVLHPLGKAFALALIHASELLSPLCLRPEGPGLESFFAALESYFSYFQNAAEIELPVSLDAVTSYFSAGGCEDAKRAVARFLRKMQTAQASADGTVHAHGSGSLWDSATMAFIGQEASLLMLWAVLKWMPSTLFSEVEKVAEQVWVSWYPTPLKEHDWRIDVVTALNSSALLRIRTFGGQ